MSFGKLELKTQPVTLPISHKGATDLYINRSSHVSSAFKSSVCLSVTLLENIFSLYFNITNSFKSLLKSRGCMCQKWRHFNGLIHHYIPSC